ncbi:hypothetical protein J6590_011763 [Homalodisca vitripennis]|nr:hypothetical protein J6590_011763 [Homalodisca vitripennis]
MGECLNNVDKLFIKLSSHSARSNELTTPVFERLFGLHTRNTRLPAANNQVPSRSHGSERPVSHLAYRRVACTSVASFPFSLHRAQCNSDNVT